MKEETDHDYEEDIRMTAYGGFEYKIRSLIGNRSSSVYVQPQYDYKEAKTPKLIGKSVSLEKYQVRSVR